MNREAVSGQDYRSDALRPWRVGPQATQIVCLSVSVAPFGGMQSDVDGINYCLRISEMAGRESTHQVLVTQPTGHQLRQC
jgi:hypothetical protein